MKNIFTICLIIFMAFTANQAWSQYSFKFTRDSAFGQGPLGSDIEDTIHIVNLTSGDVNCRWVRIYKNLPNGWTSTTCDVVNCYGETVDSADFILSTVPDQKFDIHFLPETTQGTGIIKYIVFDISAGKQTGYVLTFVGQTTSGIDGKKVNLYSLYQSNGVLNINFGNFGDYRVTILDISGKCVWDSRYRQNEAVIDINQLKNGYYFARITSADGVNSVLNFVK